MTARDVPDGLTLVCKICRWLPPADLQMNLVQAHFDVEPDHQPEDIQLELVAMCRDNVEMTLDRTVVMPGGRRHHYTCPRCHRSRTVIQRDTP